MFLECLYNLKALDGFRKSHFKKIGHHFFLPPRPSHLQQRPPPASSKTRSVVVYLVRVTFCQLEQKKETSSFQEMRGVFLTVIHSFTDTNIVCNTLILILPQAYFPYIELGSRALIRI